MTTCDYFDNPFKILKFGGSSFFDWIKNIRLCADPERYGRPRGPSRNSLNALASTPIVGCHGAVLDGRLRAGRTVFVGFAKSFNRANRGWSRG
ncbi:hypothetical protein ABIF90_007244 [Bradyrhizobium japonicum]